MKKIITDLNLTDKKVLMRVDFNVPMKEGKTLCHLLHVKASSVASYS